MLGRGDDWSGKGGQHLEAVRQRIAHEPRDRVVLFVEGDLAVFADSADEIVDKYLGFGDGNAWVLAADCACLMLELRTRLVPWLFSLWLPCWSLDDRQLQSFPHVRQCHMHARP